MDCDFLKDFGVMLFKVFMAFGFLCFRGIIKDFLV